MSEQEQKPPESGEVAVFTIDANVIDLAARRKPARPATQFFTDAERQEIRELLAYMRTQRPILDAAMTRCTILRRLTEEL